MGPSPMTWRRPRVAPTPCWPPEISTPPGATRTTSSAVSPSRTSTTWRCRACTTRWSLSQMIAPPGTVGFSIDSLFLSKEFKPTAFYNDKFYILLNASFSTGGQTEIINHTPCIDPAEYFEEEKDGQLWCHVSPHSAFQEVCPAVDTDVSTGFTCADGASSTGWMRTSWPVFGGRSSPSRSTSTTGRMGPMIRP